MRKLLFLAHFHALYGLDRQVCLNSLPVQAFFIEFYAKNLSSKPVSDPWWLWPLLFKSFLTVTFQIFFHRYFSKKIPSILSTSKCVFISHSIMTTFTLLLLCEKFTISFKSSVKRNVQTSSEGCMPWANLI